MSAVNIESMSGVPVFNIVCLCILIIGHIFFSAVKIWINETLHNIFTLDTKQQVVSVCPHLVYTHLLAYTTNGTYMLIISVKKA